MSPSRPASEGPVEVLITGEGPRVSAWCELVLRSPRLRLVGVAGPADGFASLDGDAPRYDTTTAALDALPDAAVAAALPPRAAAALAFGGALAGRTAVVGGPLHPAGRLPGSALPPDGLRVAHALATLPGIDRLARALAGAPVEVDVLGPPGAALDAFDLVAEAAALACRLLPGEDGPRVLSADGDGLAFVLGAGPARARAQVRCIPGRAPAAGAAPAHAIDAASVEVRAGSARYRFERGVEELTLDGRTRRRPCPPAAERALAMLLQNEPGPDPAARILEALADLLVRCPALDLPGPVRLDAAVRRLRGSAPGARGRPQDPALAELRALGLSGELPAAPPAPAFTVPVPAEPTELWSFRAGLKPVVFLTVDPDRADATAALFEGAACERVERRVEVGPQDRWIDDRTRGSPAVELYISREPTLGRRALELQAGGDPSQSAGELGELLGYPPCCVEAFARQQERGNNTLNRIETAARTLAAGGEGPWAWELDNLLAMVLPFFPCTYRCERALAIARAALTEMDAAHPGTSARLREALQRTVLYLDHEHQVVLGRALPGGAVLCGTARAVGGVAARRLAGAVALGAELTLGPVELVARRGGQVVLALERVDPALGFLAPFG